MKLGFAIRLSGVFALCLQPVLAQEVAAVAQPQSQEAQVESIRKTAATTAANWGTTHNCVLPLDGKQAVADKMTTLAPAVSKRRLKYDLPAQRQKEVINALTTAYLDSLLKPAAPPFHCPSSSEMVQSGSLPAVFNDPDSGFLLIDGSEGKADIYIDGNKKGSIMQMFVLSSGKHTWRTMKCEETIQIAPNDTKKVFCSKQ
jgi:hypothetical protein